MQSSSSLNKTELEAVRIIRNKLLAKGRFPTIREIMVSLGYKSPRSAAVIIEHLIEKGVLQRKSDRSLQFRDVKEEGNSSARTVDVPLLGSVACGLPIFAEENIDGLIPVSIKLAKPPHRYFFLRAIGDSMNEKGIQDGSLLLVKQQVTANNGDTVVALIDDEATVKEFCRREDMIILKPCSNNRNHKPIILTRDFQIKGVVIKSIQDL